MPDKNGPAWPFGTRLKWIPLGAKAKGASNPLQWDIPKSGVLAMIFLSIRGSLTGTLGTGNAAGFSSIVRNVRVQLNSSVDLINLSGPQYHYLLRDQLEALNDPNPQANGGRAAVAISAFDISMALPIAMNSRDPLGLIALQNDKTQVQLNVEFETDSVVASGGATVAATVIPYLGIFPVPLLESAAPPIDYLHTIRAETTVLSGAGEYQWIWPRGNTYVSIYHGLGFGVSGSDLCTRFATRVNQSDYLVDTGAGQAPQFLDMRHAYYRGRNRLAGVIPLDLMDSSGLGTYGSARDFFDSDKVTDVTNIVTSSAGGTLHTLKRELILLDK